MFKKSLKKLSYVRWRLSHGLSYVNGKYGGIVLMTTKHAIFVTWIKNCKHKIKLNFFSRYNSGWKGLQYGGWCTWCFMLHADTSWDLYEHIQNTGENISRDSTSNTVLFADKVTVHYNFPRFELAKIVFKILSPHDVSPVTVQFLHEPLSFATLFL